MFQSKIRKMLITLLLILVFAFPMTALFCMEYPTPYEQLYDYVAFGDSYSSGQTPYGDPDGKSYTDFIKEKLEYAGMLGSYHKKGVSGYTTNDVMEQLSSLKELLQIAELVTLDIGINDILNLPEVRAYRANPLTKNYNAAQAAVTQKIPEISNNIRTIIDEIKAAEPDRDPQIYIMGYFNAFADLPAFLALIEQLNAAISDTAVESGITYVDTMAAVNEKLDEYFPGDIHPTVEGYRAIAEVFWKSINEDILTSKSARELPNDINGHWADSIIKKFVEQGIVTGYEDGSFKPDKAVTRAEFVTMMNRYFGLIGIADIYFSDVSENAWYRVEVQKAVKAGYLSGYHDSSFRANEYVTRQEAAVIVARILKWEPHEEGDEAIQFLDGGGIPSWSRDSVNELLRRGILKGFPDHSLRYQGMLTRAEALSILANIAIFADIARGGVS